MFIEVPYFQENSPALKKSWLRACYLYIFSHFKKFHPSPIYTNKFLGYNLWPFKQNCHATVFVKVIQYGYETFQNVEPELINHIAKISETKFITNL